MIERYRSERAVSEVLGFIMVFGIIMASVAVLYGFGFPAVLELHEGEQTQNAFRAFEAVSENYNDLLRNDGIDERASEISVREGTVRTGGSSTELEISNDDTLTDESFELGNLVYEHEGSSVAYEGGGTFSGDDSGSARLSDPMMVCRNDVAIISLMVIDADDRSLLSSENLEITIDRQDTTEYLNTGTHSVDVTVVGGRYAGGWEMFFESDDQWDWSGSTATCQNVDRSVVRVVTADVTF